MAQLFISYSRRDLPFVERLAADLKQSGFEVWYDVSRLRGGARWRTEIQKAIKNSQFVVVVLSPDSVESEWVEREFLFSSNLKRKIIPLLYRPCELPLNYLNLNYIDVRGENYQHNFGALLEAIKDDSTNRSRSPIGTASMQPIPWRTAAIVLMIAVLGIAGIWIAVRLPFLLQDRPATSTLTLKAPDPNTSTFTPTPSATPSLTPTPTVTLTPTATTPAIAHFDGIWSTNIATLNLTQDGDRVTGSVQGYGGNWNTYVNGVVRNNVLEFDKSSIFGAISFVMSSDGSSFKSNDEGLSWCGVRTGSLPRGCGFSGKWYLKDNSSAIPSGSYAELIQSGINVTGTIYSGDGSAIDSITGTVYWGKGYGLYGKGGHAIDAFTWWVDYQGATFNGFSDTNTDMKWCGWRDTASQPVSCNY